MNATRLLSKIRRLPWRRVSVRNASASAAPEEPIVFPTPENQQKVFSAKLEKLAGEISQLNLLEVSELSELLKKKLNLPDRPFAPMGGFVMPGGVAPAPEAEEEAAPKQVQMQFTAKLTGFDESQKIALIKEIKSNLEGFNLVQAKKFVESLPAIIKADVTKEEAEKYKEIFTKVGGVVEIS